MDPFMDTSASITEESRAEWQKQLEASVREVFEMMLGSALEVVKEDESLGRTDLTGMVGLAGQVCGVLSIRCTSKTGAHIASKMTGTEVPERDASVRDALGEVCNMVAGNFKSKLPNLSDGCLLSVPTIITGVDYHLHSLASGDRMAVCLSFEGEPLSVILDIHS